MVGFLSLTEGGQCSRVCMFQTFLTEGELFKKGDKNINWRRKKQFMWSQILGSTDYFGVIYIGGQPNLGLKQNRASKNLEAKQIFIQNRNLVNIFVWSGNVRPQKISICLCPGFVCPPLLWRSERSNPLGACNV